jgi:GAF domain-containing protein
VTEPLTLAELQPPIRSVPRLIDVARLGLDRQCERPFLRDVVDAVAARLDTPFVVIDVLLDNAQVFLATSGPAPEWVGEAGGTPLEWSFCQPLVANRAPRTVGDLTADPLFRDNPLVRIEGLRAYAGAPLISHTGQVLGGLCGLDLRPRQFTADQVAFLQEMAAEVVGRLEVRAIGA